MWGKYRVSGVAFLCEVVDAMFCFCFDKQVVARNMDGLFTVLGSFGSAEVVNIIARRKCDVHACLAAKLLLCHVMCVAHCSKYRWLNVLCASKLVWCGSHGGARGGTSCDDLHWDGQSVCQRSWACVALQVDCGWCSAHLRTTHAGDCMFIVPEVVDGTLWHVAYEGRAMANAQGEQELEQRAPVFRTSASFWEVGVHEWQTNAVPSRASYTEEWQEAQWQASAFMVDTRHDM